MLFLLVASASAATLDVCPTCAYRTPEEAVAAARSRDVIRFAAGVHDTTGITITTDVTLTGDGSDVTFLRSSTADTIIHAGLTPDYGTILDVRISGITLEPPSENGISFLNTNAWLSDVRAGGFSGTAVTYSIQTGDPFRISVGGCAFSDNAIGIESRNAGPWRGNLTVEVSDSTFSGHTVAALLVSGTSLDVARSRFEQNVGSYGGAITTSADDWVLLDGNVFSGNSGTHGGAVHASWGAGLSLTGNLFCANEAESGGAVYGDVGSVTASGNVFAGNVATNTGGDLSLPLYGVASVENNTFVGGYAPTGGSLWAENHTVTFRNNIVAYTSEYGLYGDAGSATIAYNDFWEVAPDAVGGTWPAPDATNLAVDPRFASYVEGGCEELDLGLGAGSPLYDAGDPSMIDEDGTRADIGATGGTSPAEGTRRWYRDADGDGHGVMEDLAYAAAQPTGYVATPTDCDDDDANRSPEAIEHCDGVDEDCDGIVDDDATDALHWREDADGDGYQDSAVVEACDAPAAAWGPRAGVTDCDDQDATVHPGAAEICDGLDQDCDHLLDEGASKTWRPDADGDGFQHPVQRAYGCEPPPQGWAEDVGEPYDCDDTDPDAYPGAREVAGDDVDQDCDGLTDDGPDETDPERRGCSCGGVAPGPWAGILLMAVVASRRRRC